MNSKTRKKIIIITAISIPIIVAAFMEFEWFWTVETDNDWIGFYASFVGSIIGVLGVYEVTRNDQRKREEERKDELFFNNLSTYRKITSLTKGGELFKLKDRLAEIRSESDWNLIDISTKNKLKRIEGNLSYCDEHQGLFYAVRRFIEENLFDELKVSLYFSGDEFSEPVMYEDLPHQIVDQVLNVVINIFEIDLTYENSINITISKDELLKKFEQFENTQGYSDQMDSIYKKLANINESKEWSQYIDRRKAMFEQIHDLHSYINNRIEKILDY